MVHAFRYFGEVTATILTDNMKTVVVDRVEGQPRFHPKMLDFASYYGFLPRVCHPYRPQTKGKIESAIRYVKSSFWPPPDFNTLAALNAQALVWCEEANRRVHATTREVPLERFAREGLTPLGGQPDYDTSYVRHRRAAKDCLLSYRGNRYSVPHAFAGRRSTAAASPLRGWRDAVRLRAPASAGEPESGSPATGREAGAAESRSAPVQQRSPRGRLPSYARRSGPASEDADSPRVQRFAHH